MAILGPRQVGKTTLARSFAESHPGPVTLFDLERPSDLASLEEPELALERLQGLVIMDEIQRRPDIFPVLRALVDRPDASTQFLVLGSASPDLLKQSSESLAGRIAYHRMSGFNLEEVGIEELDPLWMRGGFPRSFTAKSLEASDGWRHDFIATFLERDLPQLGITIPAPTLHRFWKMLAHYHGQIWKGSEIGRALGVSHHTVRGYLDILESTYVVRVLPPWFENLKKRQVKSPKIYIADSGLLHSLLGISEPEELYSHPKVGASWEGFLLSTVLEQIGDRPTEAYFWAAHTGAELDLLLVRGQKRLGFEFKRTSSPKMTSSIRSALADLHLDRMTLVHAGPKTFPIADNVEAVAAVDLLEHLAEIG